MHRILHTLVVLFICQVALVGCKRHSSQWETLDAASNILEDYPDSALVLLETVDKSLLYDGEERARYALLMSMALDKNYIDTTTFDVLQPAIDYYEKHGNADERLKTAYYKGIIYYNSNDYNNCMRSFAEGLLYKDKVKDRLTLARLYATQGDIYEKLYNIEHFIQNNLEAQEIFKEYNKNKSITNTLFRLVEGYIVLGDTVNADKYLDLARDNVNKLDTLSLSKLVNAELLYSTSFGDSTSIKNVIERSPDLITANSHYIRALLALGKNESALSEYQKLPEPEFSFYTMDYYLLGGEVYAANCDFENAYKSYENAILATGELETHVYRDGIQFIELRSELERKALDERNKRIQIALISIFSLIWLISVIVILYFRNKAIKARQSVAEERWLIAEEREKIAKERERAAEIEAEKNKLEYEKAQAQIESLEGQRDSLSLSLDNIKDKKSLLAKVLAKRIRLINAILATNLSDNPKHEKALRRELDKLLDDNQGFLDSLREGFFAISPKLEEYLIGKGLTLDQQNYMCLSILGLTGREIGRIMGRKACYNIAYTIRQQVDDNALNSSIIRKYVNELFLTSLDNL